MKKLLIVEDDAQLQEIYKESLKDSGYEVIQAENAGEGLLFAQQKKPDLIILDIMLPGGANGFDILEAMKRDDRIKKIPVWVCTNLDVERETALNIGAEDYIVKANTSIDEIIQKIKNFLK